MTATPGAHVWRARIDRATRLAEDGAAAEELLRFYVKLLDVQEWLFYHPAAARAPAPTRLRDFPWDGLLDAAPDFLSEVAAFGPSALRDAAGALDADALLARVEDLLAPSPSAMDARDRFLAAAFVQPVAVRIAAATIPTLPAGGSPPPHERRCRLCDQPAHLASVRDDARRPGALSAECLLCASSWEVPRVTCLACGETDSEALRSHTADAWPHVHVQSCDTCGAYGKMVDLRENGLAVPAVDDVASTEVDLWARAQGWTRPVGHLFGP